MTSDSANNSAKSNQIKKYLKEAAAEQFKSLTDTEDNYMPEDQLEFELINDQKRLNSKKRNANPHSAFIMEQKK